MVFEALSEEASLSDVFLYLTSDLASALIYKLRKFSWWLPLPPTGHAVLGLPFFPCMLLFCLLLPSL